MAINFPTSPSINDIHTVGSRKWQWTGTTWESIMSGAIDPTMGGDLTGTASNAQIAAGAVDNAALDSDLTFTGESIIVPVGTTAQRPSSPANGMLRYNTDLTQYEAYKNGSWGSLGGSTIDQDLDTYIEVETSPGADNDDIKAFTAGTKRWETDQDGVTTYPAGYLQLPSFTS